MTSPAQRPKAESVQAEYLDQEALPPMAQSLPVRLTRFRETLMLRIRPVLRAHGLTEQQWRVLCTVRDLEESEITALAEQVFLLPPSLSRILRDLEARGLMLRRGSALDQRRALVSVTPAGEVLIHRVEPSLVEVRLQMREVFGPERLRALGDLLDELETVLGPLPTPTYEE